MPAPGGAYTKVYASSVRTSSQVGMLSQMKRGILRRLERVLSTLQYPQYPLPRRSPYVHSAQRMSGASCASFPPTQRLSARSITLFPDGTRQGLHAAPGDPPHRRARATGMASPVRRREHPPRDGERVRLGRRRPRVGHAHSTQADSRSRAPCWVHQVRVSSPRSAARTYYRRSGQLINSLCVHLCCLSSF